MEKRGETKHKKGVFRMEKQETKLTQEVYESIVKNLINDTVRLKQKQGEIKSNISTEKEVLLALKQELKGLKKDIKQSKLKLYKSRKSLRITNRTLSKRNNSIVQINSDFIAEEERIIDLNAFAINQPKKRR